MSGERMFRLASESLSIKHDQSNVTSITRNILRHAIHFFQRPPAYSVSTSTRLHLRGAHLTAEVASRFEHWSGQRETAIPATRPGDQKTRRDWCKHNAQNDDDDDDDDDDVDDSNNNNNVGFDSITAVVITIPTSGI
jgi:hypothetical protein